MNFRLYRHVTTEAQPGGWLRLGFMAPDGRVFYHLLHEEYADAETIAALGEAIAARNVLPQRAYRERRPR